MATQLQDAFTDSDSVSLDAHVMSVGAGWTEALGNWDVQSNRANLAADAGDGQNVAWADAGLADVTISADVISAGSGSIEAGLLLNYTDANNYWFWALSTFDAGEVLYERAGGTFTKRKDTDSGAPATSTTFGLKATLKGDRMGLYKNGTIVAYYSATNRPQKSAAKHGLREYRAGAGGDQGSRFDNLLVVDAEPIILPPTLLNFTQLGSAQWQFQPFDDRFAIHADAFDSDTSANYTATDISGSSSVAIGSGTAVFSGASAGSRFLRINAAAGAAPYMFAKLEVTSVSSTNNVVPFVGFRKDANNYTWAYVYQSQLNIDSKVGGNQVLGAAAGSYTPPYTIYCAVNYPEVWAWIDTGSGPVAQQYIVLNRSEDLRLLTKWSTDWKPILGFDRLAGGESGTATAFSSGYTGAAPGVRDFKPVIRSDGMPWQVGTKQYFTATFANGADFESNHLGIITVDVVTGAAEIVSQLFFRISTTDTDNSAATKDACTSLYGGQIVRKPDNSGWYIFTNGWGYQDVSTGVDIFLADTSANILSGTHVIDAYSRGLWSTKSLYDCSWRLDGATWKMACTETATVTGWTDYYAAYYEGTDINSMTQVRNDSASGREAEQQCFCRIGDAWYITAGGTGGPHYWNADLSSYLGSLLSTLSLGGTNVSYSGFGSGYIVTPVPQPDGTSSYLALLFSDDQLLSASATKGKLVVEQSAERRDGREFPDSSLGRNQPKQLSRRPAPFRPGLVTFPRRFG